MVKPGVYTVDKKQLKNGEKTTEYVHVEVQPLPPKPSETINRKGCTCMRLLGVFLFLLVLAGIAIALAFAIRWDAHPENNGDDCINCYDGWTPEAPHNGEPHHGDHPNTPEDRPDRPPGYPDDRPPEDHRPPGHPDDDHHGDDGDDDDGDDDDHHGRPGEHDDDHGGHDGRPGDHDGDDDEHHGRPGDHDDDDDHGGHHGGPGHNDGDHGGHHGGPGHHDGGHHGGHDGRPDDHDGHGDDDEPLPPIDYVGTPRPLLGRPDGHDGFPPGGFPGDDRRELMDRRDTHGKQYYPRFTGIESWKQQRAVLKSLGYKKPAPRVEGRSRVEIEEEALERSPHDGKAQSGRKRF